MVPVSTVVGFVAIQSWPLVVISAGWSPLAMLIGGCVWLGFEFAMMAWAGVLVFRYYAAIDRGEEPPKDLLVRAVYSGQFPEIRDCSTVAGAVDAVKAASRSVKSSRASIPALVLALVVVCVAAAIVTEILYDALPWRSYAAIQPFLLGGSIATFVLVTATWFRMRVRWIGRAIGRGDRLCPLCGYDLSGLDELACPECGWNRG